MPGAGALIAAVTAGDTDAVARLLAADPGLAGAKEDGISAVRLALYHRQPGVLEVLLQHSPPLDGLDHAALGWTEELRQKLARRSRAGQAPLGRRVHRAALRRASSAARPPPACCSSRAPTRTRSPTTRCASGRCTRPPRRATPRRRGAARGRRRPGRGAGGRVHGAARRGAARRRRERRVLLRHGADPRCATTRAPTPRGLARATRRSRCWRCSADRVRPGAQSPKWTLPFERARACARSTKSSRLIAPRNSRVTSFSRARLGAQVEQALLGLEPELDGRRHLVGRHRADLVGVRRAVGRLLDELGVDRVRLGRGVGVGLLLAVVEELDDAGRIGELLLARLDPEHARAARDEVEPAVGHPLEHLGDLARAADRPQPVVGRPRRCRTRPPPRGTRAIIVL